MINFIVGYILGAVLGAFFTAVFLWVAAKPNPNKIVLSGRQVRFMKDLRLWEDPEVRLNFLRKTYGARR